MTCEMIWVTMKRWSCVQTPEHTVTGRTSSNIKTGSLSQSQAGRNTAVYRNCLAWCWCVMSNFSTGYPKTTFQDIRVRGFRSTYTKFH